MKQKWKAWWKEHKGDVEVMFFHPWSFLLWLALLLLIIGEVAKR